MWILFTRAPLPDAPYWRGRRLLAGVDAVGWPLAWGVLAVQLPQPAGIVGPMLIAVAVVCAIGRVHRALWFNHRYHFTTWRWGRWLAGVMVIGLMLRLALRV
jgi:hypothetical protein